jgi:hypothetical protein
MDINTDHLWLTGIPWYTLQHISYITLLPEVGTTYAQTMQNWKLLYLEPREVTEHRQKSKRQTM